MSRSFLTPADIRKARGLSKEDSIINESMPASAGKGKSVSPQEISDSVRASHGLSPEEKEVIYESHTQEIIETVGKPMADEMFEKAKNIVQQRALEIQINGDINNQKGEHTTKADTMPLKRNIGKVKRIPGPKRRKRK